MRSTVSGTALSAFAALLAILIESSSILTTYRFSPGSLSVVPAPTNAVLWHPIAWVEPAPAWWYLTVSPLTKKWFGRVIVLSSNLTIAELSPKKYFSKIGSFLWVKLKVLLISLSVPSYSPNPDLIDPFHN